MILGKLGCPNKKKRRLMGENIEAVWTEFSTIS
jgi:hypothetical protein